MSAYIYNLYIIIHAYTHIYIYINTKYNHQKCFQYSHKKGFHVCPIFSTYRPFSSHIVHVGFSQVRRSPTHAKLLRLAQEGAEGPR